MRKIYFIGIFFLFMPTIVFGHPGNLDSSGGHYCWTNCAEWGYSEGQYHQHCIPPTSSEYTSEAQCMGLQSQLIKNGTQRYASEMATGVISDCYSKVTQYQGELDKFNNCVSLWKSNNTQSAELEIDFEEMKRQMYDDYINKQTTTCHEYMGINSYFSEGDVKCYCKDGYINTSKGCLTHTESCQLSFGVESYGDGEWCYCNDGYEFFTSELSGKKLCVKKQPIIKPTVSTTTEQIVEEQTTEKIIETTQEPIKETVEIKPVEKPVVNQIKIIEKENKPIEIVKQVTTTQTMENNAKPLEESPTTQKTKENVNLIVRQILSFVKNILGKLKFW